MRLIILMDGLQRSVWLADPVLSGNANHLPIERVRGWPFSLPFHARSRLSPGTSTLLVQLNSTNLGQSCAAYIHLRYTTWMSKECPLNRHWTDPDFYPYFINILLVIPQGKLIYYRVKKRKEVFVCQGWKNKGRYTFWATDSVRRKVCVFSMIDEGILQGDSSLPGSLYKFSESP